MSTKFSLPRGTSDLLPQDISLWQKVEQTSRTFFHNYNYKEIRTPYFEETQLFARSMGQTTDVVLKQMLTLKSQAEAEDATSLTLRPEGTAGVLRAYLQDSLDRKESLTKVFYIGPMFRGERPQKGRLRQFHQIGAEAIGPDSASPFLDAEMIALAVSLLKALGLNNFELKINTIGTQADRESFSRWLREHLKKDIEKLSPELQASFKQNVFRILDSKDRDARALVDKLKLDGSYLSKESRDYFEQVKSALDDLNIKYIVKPTLVRGLDYYTHTVFEISDSSLGSQDALGAGGRYNNLAAQLGGAENVGAIGFALGIERILLAANGNLTVAEQPLSYYIIVLDEANLKQGFLTLNTLRQAGISGDMSYRAGSMKSQMRAADKSGATYVVILGEDEIKRNVLTVKNMKTGEQQTINQTELVGFAKENH